MSGHVFGNERKIGRNITFFQSAAQQNNYKGSFGELSFAWDTCELRIHDGCKCGGKGLADNAGLTPEQVKAIALQCIIDNQTPDLAVENFTQNGDVITLLMNDGTEFEITIDHPPVPDEEGEYIVPDATLDIDAQTLTFGTAEDEGEAAGAYNIDLSALFTALTSPDAPNFTGNGVTFDPATNTYTITDTDTAIPDTFYRTAITGPDADGNYTVTETDTDGNEVSSFSIVTGGTKPLLEFELINDDCDVRLMCDGVPVPNGTFKRRHESQAIPFTGRQFQPNQSIPAGAAEGAWTDFPNFVPLCFEYTNESCDVQTVSGTALLNGMEFVNNDWNYAIRWVRSINGSTPPIQQAAQHPHSPRPNDPLYTQDSYTVTSGLANVVAPNDTIEICYWPQFFILPNGTGGGVPPQYQTISASLTTTVNAQ